MNNSCFDFQSSSFDPQVCDSGLGETVGDEVNQNESNKPEEMCSVSNNPCFDCESSSIDPRVCDSGEIKQNESKGDGETDCLLTQNNIVEEVLNDQGETDLLKADSEPRSETVQVQLVSPHISETPVEPVRSQRRKRHRRNRKRTSKEMVRDIEYGEPSTACIESQIFYRGGKGIPTSGSQIPIKTQVFYRSKQPYKLPSRVFWQSKDTSSHNKGKWLAGPGYLKANLLKGNMFSLIKWMLYVQI